MLSPNLHAEYIMQNVWLDESQAGIKIAGSNINSLIYADDITLMAESKEERKSLLMKVKEESEEVGWKLNIQKTKIMASSPITSWQIDGETMKQWDTIFLGSNISADGDCSHEMKRRLLLGRKAMTNLDSILKSRDITLPTKVHIVKATVFPVLMYRCESRTIKKPECQRIDALEEDLDSMEIQPVNPKGNQSWLFIGKADAEDETPWLMLKMNTLATWCEELTHWKRPWCWERLKAKEEGDDRRWDD